MMLAAILDHSHLPVLLVIGFAIFAGALGGRLFARLHIPQVVGYIIIGVVLGPVVGLLGPETVEKLSAFNFFALGIIGFMIGGELHREVFRKYGWQFFSILLAEGLGAFVVVGPLVFLAAWMLGQELNLAIALGLLLGAISSATAPAATVDVLWEYKTRGPLTTTVFAIVALDDALALVLFGVAASFAGLLVGSSDRGLLAALGFTLYELIGAALLGVLAGMLLNYLLRKARDPDKSLTFILGTLAVVLGLSLALQLDVILAAMALGVTLVNLAPRRSRESFHLIERFAPPIYVLFFVIVGARLNISDMPLSMLVLAVLYVVGRTVGKWVGSSLGARWGKAPATVRKYLGLCLFSQAGVAIGLALIASETFNRSGQEALGNAIITIVTATTFLVQIIGPTAVKVAAKRAGEIGLNISEKDLMRSYQVRDVVNRSAPRISVNEPNARDLPTFSAATPLASILPTISESEAMVYPVVDKQNRLQGVITIQELRQAMGNVGMAEWLLAVDLMVAPPDRITEDMPLEEAFARMEELRLDYLPVVKDTESNELVGLLEMQAVNRLLSQEILRRRHQADTALLEDREPVGP
jgi:Kef-type K+ transport system membrane component KefB